MSTGGAARYTHWRERGGDWSGRFNTTSLKYETQNVSNILHSLLVVDEIAKRYGNHPVVIGLEPGKCAKRIISVLSFVAVIVMVLCPFSNYFSSQRTLELHAFGLTAGILLAFVLDNKSAHKWSLDHVTTRHFQAH